MTATIHHSARVVAPPIVRRGEPADHTVVRLMMKLRTGAGQTDPWPIYHHLRNIGEIVPTSWGGLLLTSYGACDEVRRGRRQCKVPDRVWRARHGGPRWSALSSREFGRTLLALNGYEHARTRRSTGPLFDHSFLDGFGEWLTARTGQLLDGYFDRLRDGEDADFAALVSEELPIATVGHWLRLPTADLPQLRALIHRQTAAQELLPSPRELEAADTAMVELRDYVTDLINQRRAAPGDDPVSGWLATWDRSGAARPAADETVHYLTLLMLLAAVETTTSLLSTTALLLARHSDQRAQLASRPDPEQIAAAVEEVLRYDPPTHLISRVAAVDTRLAGRDIPAGQLVHALVGAAHRDPRRHANAGSFDVERAAQGHMAFSAGAHYCLGAPLARLEAQTLLAGLLRHPSLDPAGEPQWAPGVVFRRIVELPLALTEAGR